MKWDRMLRMPHETVKRFPTRPVTRSSLLFETVFISMQRSAEAE
jgi:hypothetical protein